MNSPFTVVEIRAHMHPILEGHSDWLPVKFEASIEAGSAIDVTIAITRTGNRTKRLRFRFARLPDSTPGLRLNLWRGPLYIADISSVQWDNLTVEVGALDEEYPTAFFAASVEELV